MELKLLLFIFVVSHKFVRTNPADIFDDRPKILIQDGNLVLESAESRDVSVRLKGKSRFLVNDVDVLKKLNPSNTSSDDGASSSSANLDSLAAQVTKLNNLLKGRVGVLKRLERIEVAISTNTTLPNPGTPERNRINGLQRRVVTLEQRVANLTERLMRDHCKSYPCQNGGTCFNMFETFRCECPANWEGPTCSLDVNECSKFVGTDLGCQNDATCINTPGSYE